MNPLKGRVTVGLFVVTIAAAACGSSSTSSSAKPSRGFTGTTVGQQPQIPLVHPSSNALSCPGATSGTPTGGFAVFKQNADNTVSVDVELKKAVPDTTYFASVWLTTSGDCFNLPGPADGFKSNGEGVVNAHISVPARSGTTGAWVSVWARGEVPGTTRDSQSTANYVFGS